MKTPAVVPSRPAMLTCPFCWEDDFDAIGLKHHLLFHCEEFDATPGLNAAVPPEGEGQKEADRG